MSTKNFAGSILFSIILSGIFAACYGPELDRMDDDIEGIGNRLTSVEDALKAIDEKLAAGKFIARVMPVSNGFDLLFSDGSNIELHHGTNGAPGTTWAIIDSMWWKDGVPVAPPARALPRDGKPGLNAPSPQIGASGHWIVYEWVDSVKTYRPVTTPFKADTATAYMVDKGLYYDFFVPLKDSVTGIMQYDSIRLPRYEPPQEPELVIHFKGFGRISNDSTVRMIDNPALSYWCPPNITDETGQLTGYWLSGTKIVTPGQLLIPELRDNAIAVFSLNKTPPAGATFKLLDSRNGELKLVNLSPAVEMKQFLLTKTNQEALYYARITESLNPPASLQPVKTGNIFYSLAADTVKSISSYPVTVKQGGGIASDSDVETVGGYPSTDGVFYVPLYVNNKIAFDGNSNYVYDYYIKESDFAALEISTDKTTFRLTAPAKFNVVIFKLLVDGRITTDTIAVESP